MTVRELVDALRAMPQDAPVFIEGELLAEVHSSESGVLLYSDS